MTKVPSIGPRDADIMLVGEAPGAKEVEKKRPFVGGSGQELRRMLAAAGINMSNCFVTNVCKLRPPGNNINLFFMSKTEAKRAGLADPDFARVQGNKTTYPKEEILDGLLELEEEIQSIRPKVIIALGGTALWALCRESSIEKWAGSHLEGPLGSLLLPTNHPARVLRQWELRNITIADLRRVSRHLHAPQEEPRWNFKTNPSFGEVIGFFDELDRQLHSIRSVQVPLACDIETTSTHHIGCIGFGTSETDAICIPFTTREPPFNYWEPEDELEIINRIRRLFSRRDVTIIGQNFAFDAQYTARDWGCIPNKLDDTMVGHHLCYPGTPKGLDYLSRFYLPFHRYWKDEGKFIDEKVDLDRWYRYNCKDCCATFAVWSRISQQIDHFNLRDQYEFQMSMWPHLLRSMIRGVNIDREKKTEFMLNAQFNLHSIDEEMLLLSEGVIPSKGKTPWWRSPTQCATVFYEMLRYPKMFQKKTKRPTTDDDALTKLRKKDPLLMPIIDRILGQRSLAVFTNTFLNAGLGPDGRMRTTYDLCGTKSFRLASREDSFGGGTNLQNIPRLR